MTSSFAMPDLGGAVNWLAAGIARNVLAEWKFYAVLCAALAVVFVIDAIQRRDVVARYTSRGVRTDALYAMAELSHLQGLLVLAPASAWIAAAMHTGLPWLKFDGVAALPLWVQVITFLIIGDFWQYWCHRLKHVSPWLWQFHKIHHSQRELTVLTRFRFPILDRLLSVLLLIPVGVISGSSTVPVTLYVLMALRSCLEHSGLNWTYGPLGRLIVSPSFHAVHHSRAPEHMDRNFGGVFAIWDHLFGTYVARGDKPLSYGLIHEDIPECFIRQHWLPLTGIWALLRRKPPMPPVKAAT